MTLPVAVTGWIHSALWHRVRDQREVRLGVLTVTACDTYITKTEALEVVAAPPRGASICRACAHPRGGKS